MSAITSQKCAAHKEYIAMATDYIIEQFKAAITKRLRANDFILNP